LKRLKRDRPDLADKVAAGEMSANAAAIEAGFRTPAPTSGDGSGCDYDPADPIEGDTYSSIWERQIAVACQNVDFNVVNLTLDLTNNLEAKGYRTKRKELEAILRAVKVWSQLAETCSRLLEAEQPIAAAA
jgi:hypothetical protein